MKIAVIWILLMVASETCYAKTRIRKCCEDGHFVLGKKQCKRLNDTETLNLSNVRVHSGNLTEIGHLTDFFYLDPGFFSEGTNRNESLIYKVIFTSFHVMENGSVLLKKGSIEQLVVADYFCIDYHKTLSAKTKSVVVFWKTESESNGNPLFYKCGFLISSIFLFLLLVVYSLLPELRSLGGMILMAYAASLMLAYLFTFIIQIVKGHKPVACLILTHLIYYFLLSAFCWMSVMSYDIWWTFRGYAKARAVHRRGVCFKFGMYCLYAFGVPLALTIALAILNETDAKYLPGIIKPDILLRGCFLDGKALLVYLYGPMLVIIILNWLFFGLTVFNIYRLSRGTQILDGGNAAAAGNAAAHRAQKHRFFVYLKLSVVMGLSWLLEVVSSFNPEFGGWYISDTYNVFVGLIIFLIFVCKRKVFKNLKNRFTTYKASITSTSVGTKSSRSRSTGSTLDSNSQSVPLKAMDAPTKEF